MKEYKKAGLRVCLSGGVYFFFALVMSITDRNMLQIYYLKDVLIAFCYIIAISPHISNLY